MLEKENLLNQQRWSNPWKHKVIKEEGKKKKKREQQEQIKRTALE